MSIYLINSDARHIPLADQSVQCVVTSPPYWGLRDYGVIGQIGLERTPQEYVDSIVAVMREVWRVLREDGVLWLNLGDSYHQGNKGSSGQIRPGDKQGTNRGSLDTRRGDSLGPNRTTKLDGIKPKDLVGIPWRVALALQADGWYLRADIIWSKPNPMPESVTDRPTRAHEYIFLLAKSERYYYDSEAIKEPVTQSSIDRINQPTFDQQTGGEKDYGATGVNTNRSMRRTLENFAVKGRGGKNAFRGQGHFRDTESGPANRDGRDMKDIWTGLTRNRRTVWTVATTPYSGAHFATFPPALVEPMIMAGSRPGDLVLDPFSGSGTVGRVCAKHGRHYVGLELNRTYIELAQRRTSKVQTALRLGA